MTLLSPGLFPRRVANLKLGCQLASFSRTRHWYDMAYPPIGTLEAICLYLLG